MPEKASTLSLEFYKDDIDDASQADKVIQDHGFHPAKHESGPIWGGRLNYNYQQYEISEENKSLIDDIVKELDGLFKEMDVWSELKTNRDAGHGAAFKTVIYVASDKDSIGL